ncbi:hypothetical protein [Roseococcus pinisoli]|uniref:Uncharacterized protein n=1 Tax=Roseococcus pinisoli TaxID=2835040 RepID=A0ABS5QFL8_9PROT|nr:hypothetical protein [Roseococcus pinisoli]MBS7812364.1 hypothetical protein [Roseococcus pinisoli]
MSFLTRAEVCDAFGLTIQYGTYPAKTTGGGRTDLDLGLFRFPARLDVWDSVTEATKDRITLLLAGPGNLGLLIVNGESGGMVLSLLDRSTLPKRGQAVFTDAGAKTVEECVKAILPSVRATFERDNRGVWAAVA